MNRNNCRLSLEIQELQSQSFLKKELSEFENKGQRDNKIQVKPLLSSKNAAEMNKKAFKSNYKKDKFPKKRSSLTISKLKAENQELIESLKILKSSAISAIVEKDAQLDCLREKQFNSSEDCYEFYREELLKSLSEQNVLIQDQKQMQNKMSQQREILSKQVFEKQQIIQRMKEYIEELENREQAYLEAIENLEDRINQLSSQLEECSLKIAVDELGNTADHEESKLNLIDKHLIACQPGKPIVDELTQGRSDKSTIEDFIAKIKRKHQEEIMQIVQYYQQRCKKLSNNKFDIDRINTLQVQTLSNALLQCNSVQRCRSQTQRHFQSPESLYFPEIDQSSQPQVHNLREQIAFPEQNLDNDTTSQFTKKHFVNPFVFKKQNSIVSLEVPQQWTSIMSKRSADQTEGTNKGQRQGKGNQENIINLFWQKTKAFGSGFISGATIGSMVSVLISRKGRL